MKKWEDIIKDKMEETEEVLPESVLDEFHALRNAASAASEPKRFPFVWVIVPIAAAGLAAILFLHRPVMPENDIRVIQQEQVPVASASSDTDVVDSEQEIQKILRKQKLSGSVFRPGETIVGNRVGEPERPKEPERDSLSERKILNHVDSVVAVPSLFIPEITVDKHVNLNVGQAVGTIAGGGLIAAIVTPFVGGYLKPDNTSLFEGNKQIGAPDFDYLTNESSHYIPLRIGVSTRIPISGNLDLTTGFIYSAYYSKLVYSKTGEKRQVANYIGIPLRLDWTFASGKWIDVYLGGGIACDYNFVATLDGARLGTDGIIFSLLGAGGIQLNANRWLGFYVEPEISYSILPNYHLHTYRSENPLMFSVNSGIRISFGKQK